MKLVRIPENVPEPSVRAVALLAGLVAILAISTGWYWLLPILAADFLVRSTFGPRLSPVARLGRLIVPLSGWEDRSIPFAPKRFAAGIGFAMLAAASIVWVASGASLIVSGITGLFAVFAVLEASIGFCAGCVMFNRAVRAGLVKHPECPDCRISVENR